MPATTAAWARQLRSFRLIPEPPYNIGWIGAASWRVRGVRTRRSRRAARHGPPGPAGPAFPTRPDRPRPGHHPRGPLRPARYRGRERCPRQPGSPARPAGPPRCALSRVGGDHGWSLACRVLSGWPVPASLAGGAPGDYPAGNLIWEPGYLVWTWQAGAGDEASFDGPDRQGGPGRHAEL